MMQVFSLNVRLNLNLYSYYAHSTLGGCASIIYFCYKHLWALFVQVVEFYQRSRIKKY